MYKTNPLYTFYVFRTRFMFLDLEKSREESSKKGRKNYQAYNEKSRKDNDP